MIKFCGQEIDRSKLEGATTFRMNTYLHHSAYQHCYKKKVVVQNKSNLLLKINLYDTQTLKLFTIKTKLNSMAIDYKR